MLKKWLHFFRRSLWGISLCNVPASAASNDPPVALTAGILQGLGVFLIVIMVGVLILKAIQRTSRFGRDRAQSLRVIGGLYLGSKEKLVLVEVGNLHLLLGITTQQITLLHLFTQGTLDLPVVSAASEPPFATYLKQAWQRVKK